MRLQDTQGASCFRLRDRRVGGLHDTPEPIEVSVGGRRVKRYKLTEAGRKELERLESEYQSLTRSIENLEKILGELERG